MGAKTLPHHPIGTYRNEWISYLITVMGLRGYGASRQCSSALAASGKSIQINLFGLSAADAATDGNQGREPLVDGLGMESRRDESTFAPTGLGRLGVISRDSRPWLTTAAAPRLHHSDTFRVHLSGTFGSQFGL